MRTIKKLNLIFGQMLDEEQQSMVLAGGKAPCGCEKKGDVCLSSVECNLPLDMWSYANSAKLVMKPGPSGISVTEARDRVKSGWEKYVNDCAAGAGCIDPSLTIHVDSHLVRECTYVNSTPDINGVYHAQHNDLGSVFCKR